MEDAHWESDVDCVTFYKHSAPHHGRFSYKGATMITGTAIFAITIVAFWVGRVNSQESSNYDRMGTDQARYALLLHIRQDLKLISFALFVVIILLAVIADLLLGR